MVQVVDSGAEFRRFLCFIGGFSLACFCIRGDSPIQEVLGSCSVVNPTCGFLNLRLECKHYLGIKSLV